MIDALSTCSRNHNSLSSGQIHDDVSHNDVIYDDVSRFHASTAGHLQFDLPTTFTISTNDENCHQSDPGELPFNFIFPPFLNSSFGQRTEGTEPAKYLLHSVFHQKVFEALPTNTMVMPNSVAQARSPHSVIGTCNDVQTNYSANTGDVSTLTSSLVKSDGCFKLAFEMLAVEKPQESKTEVWRPW